MTTTILSGDCRELLKTLPDRSVQMCLTSPPYFGLRQYLPNGHEDAGKEIGLERTPDAYVAELVAVFREVRRVLRDDGVLFLNLGDSYSRREGAGGSSSFQRTNNVGTIGVQRRPIPKGLKDKDLIGIPWMTAFALRADGWYLRSDCIWSKPNPMPESVTDRPTKSHEYVFLLTKKDRYFYDSEAVKEEAESRPLSSWDKRKATEPVRRGDPGLSGHVTSTATLASQEGRNLRSVWTIATQPYTGAHFATMPPDLAERCIKAGSSERGCCPSCGAPWKRVLGKPDFSQQPKRATSKDGHLRNGDRTSAGQAWQDWRNANPDKMLGWKPTCKCADHTPVPCTVLDPFSGAATTLLVADRLGRNAIGIDLNPQYKTMGRNRIIDDAPLFAEVAD